MRQITLVEFLEECMRERGEREGGVREGKRGGLREGGVREGKRGEGIKSIYLHRYTHTKNVCTCIYKVPVNKSMYMYNVRR